jgi:hypothetical protein
MDIAAVAIHFSIIHGRNLIGGCSFIPGRRMKLRNSRATWLYTGHSIHHIILIALHKHIPVAEKTGVKIGLFKRQFDPCKCNGAEK